MQVMFVCVHNAGRSQMAEAFFNAMASEGMHAVSAGTEPAELINPAVVEAMAEVGVAIIGQHPKLATPEMVDQSDLIITMGCGVRESCPLYLGIRIDADWGLADPAGQEIDAVRSIRDTVQAHVKELIARLMC